jgi:hypothetical protein
MTRTDEKVSYSPQGKEYSLTPTAAARGVEDALKILEGHWKLVILFHLFGGKAPLLGAATGDSRDLSEDAHPASFARWKPMGSSEESSIIRFHSRSSIA